MRGFYELVADKRDGKELAAEEIIRLVEGYTVGEIEDYQFAAFLMAAFIRGLSERETAALTAVMLASGKRLSVSGLQRPLIDKHSTGGVGDKLSLIISPLAAQCGLAVGMISGRGLGHTGGTLDKLESIPGMQVFHSIDRFASLLRKRHFAITGQTADIAPADRKIYALRDVTGTVESIPLIVASIMSKKLALTTDGIVFDVKNGSGAFMKEIGKAAKLAKALLSVARGHDLPARAVISNMNQPTGRMIGNFLEIIEVVEVLQGGGPADTVEMSAELCGQMLLVGGIESSLTAARRRARQMLASGEAYEVFCRYVADCGGESKSLQQPRQTLRGVHKAVVKSGWAGYIKAIDTTRLGFLASRLGAGRGKASDRIDPTAGIEMQVKIGDRIGCGDALAVLYTRDRDKLDQVRRDLPATFETASSKPKKEKLVLRRLANG